MFPVSRTGADLGRVWGGVGAIWLRETRCDPAPGGGSDGKDVGEVVGKRAECDEPCADEDEDAAAPGLDGWGAVLDGADEAFASGGEEHGQREHQRDDGDTRDEEGDCCGIGPAGGEGLAGQTGQDRAGSAEPSEQVDEPEEHEPGEGASPPQRCLLAQYAVERGLEAPQVDLDAVELDETEQDEDGADDDAQGPAGAAGEGDIFDQRSGAEGERTAGEDQESGGADGQGGGVPASARRIGRPLGALVVRGLASMVTSSGNEHGEKNEATPAAVASTRSPAPAPAGRSKRGYRT